MVVHHDYHCTLQKIIHTIYGCNKPSLFLKECLMCKTSIRLPTYYYSDIERIILKSKTG